MKRITVLYAAAIAAAVLVQGFQCGSAEMTTARRAMQQKDFSKAKQALTSALAQNPDNAEALVMLGGVYDALEQSDSALITYQRALANPNLKSDQRNIIGLTLFQQWAAAYNKGIKAFNDAMVAKGDRQLLTEARDNFQNATRIKPEYTEVYGNLGETLERLGDTAAAIDVYNKFWQAEQSGIDALTSVGITLGGTRGEAIKALGTPLKTKMDSIDKGVLYGDAFTLGGKKVFIYSYTESAADAVVEGWRYDPPSTLSQQEMERARILSINPLKNLAFIQYARADYADALKWADIVAKVRPDDQELSALRAQSLTRSGKGDAAITDLQRQIAKDPKSVQLRLQLMSMYSNLEKYEDAIKVCEEALAIEPTNEIALYEGAAAAKNLAADKQREQVKLSDDNPKHVVDTSYKKLLTKAAGYFEQLRKVSARFKDDYIVIGELANTYEVLKDTPKVKALISELEALEAKYSNDENYYRVLEGLYARNKMIDKMKDAQSKGAKLNGK